MVPLYTMPVARQLPFMGQFVGFWQLHVFLLLGVVWLVVFLVSGVVVVFWGLRSFLLCAEMIEWMLFVQL